ncbi:conserved hypothetical protein [Vibrio nigripulchritudo MADA3029]|uniref:lipase family protein n=1 Tax=Vibrio nigripulchritudo TaxID=28173 RepID=UPI0003B1D186|nr:lipase family protein [Vibrio nigripulchritudo]CCN37370.1 conserved hypothetical protein [Vibrio nigripulchritudo AM115]CCN41988.1 conserved hypothetical protein [Vibrio nigripulchritudo FTn2]CCN47562.1 conserved hypothetical protein [Vibrio nigripulchritudo MADA3020]CCN55970.1 conserved hypothetical protein [Vibrio nigripulchritudo MADA3021]CCN57192.1 conserved hypothetical protein [Vibrio nigripulchritudo MADA3029]
MRSLSPKLASRIAEVPYMVFAGNTRVSPYIKKQFTFDMDSHVFKGSTGGFLGVGSMTSNFAVAGIGKSDYSGHLVISFRGTEKNAGDILADGNIGLKGSYSGQSVHAGFANLFTSIQPQLVKLLSSMKTAPKVIHCVGHSLGGAIASLAADWIKARYSLPVHLYTFGAPRVGLKAYSMRDVDKSYRCTHGADPVTMIPLWPFMHAGNEYRLDGSSGIYFCTHGLSVGSTPGYVNTANSEGWSLLKKRSTEYIDKRVVLSYHRRREAVFNPSWIQKILSAILTLLRDSGFAHVVQIGALMPGLTAWDMLARTMSKIAKLKESFDDRVKGIIGHINVMSGNPAINISSISYAAIKWSFSRLIKKLYAMARSAINLTR